MRSIKIGYKENGELRVVEEIPIPQDLWICDLCNSQIKERPIPVYCGYALCRECQLNLLRKYPEDEGEIEYLTEDGEVVEIDNRN